MDLISFWWLLRFVDRAILGFGKSFIESDVIPRDLTLSVTTLFDVIYSPLILSKLISFTKDNFSFLTPINEFSIPISLGLSTNSKKLVVELIQGLPRDRHIACPL